MKRVLDTSKGWGKLGTCPKTPATVVGMASVAGSGSVATLPDLPYDYNSLNPVIIPEIMELHHKKHHQTYITNLNKALEQAAEAEHKGDLSAMIALQSAIKFNGGGMIQVKKCVVVWLETDD